ncbi:MAG: PASTA domain-containing protein [Rikenellaceae bacterium]|nr:PASTA domain-containing protein [Rikenellaceae bacterium]
MAQEPKRIKDDILLRVRILYLLFFVVGFIIAARLVCVQYFSRDTRVNAEKLERKIFKKEAVLAHRGTIFARSGEPLATSIFRYTVLFDFGCEGFDNESEYRRQCDSLSKLLALHFKDKSAKQYYDRFMAERKKHFKIIYKKDTLVPRSDGWFDRLRDRMRDKEFKTVKLYDTVRDHSPVRMFRDVDYSEWQTLRTYPILNWSLGMSYDMDKHDERVFTRQELARCTIGRSSETQGAYGIEHIFREALCGKDGVELRQRIAPKFSARIESDENIDAIDGTDVYTTIDIDVQEVADRALRNQLEKENGIWGTTMVMEAATGDILAMVNLSRNKQGKYVENYNHALKSRAEPGSTFKLAVLLSLLEEAGLPLSTEYDSGSGKKVMITENAPKIKVEDSHNVGSVIDMRKAMAESANVYFAKAVYETYNKEPERFVKFLRSLHLDRKVLTSMPDMGEATPRFPYPGSSIWYKHTTLIKLGYGYGIEVTPIQTLTLYNAVANGGKMVAPRLVTKLVKDDEVVEEFPVEVLVDKICSDKTLAMVRECLEGVALEGTAKEYFGENKVPFRAGAKTGTAQFAQGSISYGDGYYIGSMVAYFPAENPRYTVLTSIFKKRGTGTYYGAGLAGPVEKKVSSFIYNREHDWYGRVEHEDVEHFPKEVKGGNIAQTRKVADHLSPRTTFDRRAGWGSAKVDSASTVVIESLPDEPLRMPDVRGMGLKDALFILESRGLKVSVKGKGAVSKQSIRAGEPVSRGAKIELILK